jgi:hypothetical protein
MTQELSSVDRVVLTTELERILDELVAGQSQISVEFEDNGEEDTERTLTVTTTPVGPTTKLIEEEPIEEGTVEDNGGEDDSGDDDGGDD